jgi:hypothetical protein
MTTRVPPLFSLLVLASLAYFLVRKKRKGLEPWCTADAGKCGRFR